MKKAALILAALVPFAVALAPAQSKEIFTCERECYRHCHGNFGSPKRKLVCQEECIRKCHEERGELWEDTVMAL